MKIVAYEVRADEREELEAVARNLGVELVCTNDVASVASAGLAAGCEGATFLGQGSIGAALLGTWYDMGVRYLSTRTVGVDHVDLGVARSLGMRVANVGYPPNGVAEFTVMLMLLALRSYKPALWHQQVNDYSLAGLEGRELGSQTVGIVGCGRIGRAVAQCLSGFGCHILGYDPHPMTDDGHIRYVPLDKLYEQSDIVSLHMPLLQSTEHMVDAAALAKMRDGVVVVNCARGGLCETEAIIEGIESGKIGAFAADVLEGEEGVIHVDHRTQIVRNRKMAYLRQFPNVVLTQHMAFYTDMNVAAMARGGIQNIVDMAQDRPCANELL